MKTGAFRTIEVLLSVAILAIAVDPFLILYLSGYSLSLPFVTIKAQSIASPTILLMALILSRVSMQCYASAGMDLSPYLPAILFCAFLILYLTNGVTKPSVINFFNDQSLAADQSSRDRTPCRANRGRDHDK